MSSRSQSRSCGRSHAVSTPAILSEGGLGPALRTLARRAAIPVELEIGTHDRVEEPIEVAAYYVVSEALTNTTKHAHASHVRVAVEKRDSRRHLSIVDDGVGGTDPAGGSGLIGLNDRVHALDGSIEVDSRSGHGTAIVAEVPLRSGATKSWSRAPPLPLHATRNRGPLPE